MQKKILYIDPVYDNSYLHAFKEHFEKIKYDHIDIHVTSLGEKKGPKHVEYSCYEAMVIPDLIKTVKEAQDNQFDGVIIGCFYDPALRACREIADNMIVTAPAEASFTIAQSLGENIAIIVGREKTIPEIKRNIFEYGMERRFSTFKSVGLGVLDFQKDHEVTMRKIRHAAQDAIENHHADVIILGCTAELGFYEELQKELGVPVLDASIAALKYAEFLVEINKTLGWGHSKVNGYESPPLEEARCFGIFDRN
ncbi:aspartate/glutamate racemase family protein [Siminovitchia sp. FSL H7-0308]|uniref:aspartate/glutamate racemase family protein n=1 Tax=Siminovitchia sp. FSL H7-0308 TaxID=2921432 RepID=UPI0030EC3C58